LTEPIGVSGKSERARTAGAAGRVSFAVAISRVLGLIRELIFASYFGATAMADAWNVAFRVPNLLRDLFAEGALSSAFVPTFSRILENEGRDQAWHLTNLIMTLLIILLGLFGILLLLIPELPVQILASGFAEVPAKFKLTLSMTKILAPFLLFVALAAVAMGIMNAFHIYFLPALAPASFNVLIIASCLIGVPLLAARELPIIYAAAVGATLGAFFQLVVQLPRLWALGFRPHLKLDLRHPGVRQIGRLVGPAVVGVSALQLNLVVNTTIASTLGDGPISWLNYAFRIMYLPIGLFAVAVGTVNLREVSLFAARQDQESLRRTLANSIRLVGVLVTPSLVGIILLSNPLVRTLFEHGRFTALDTERTAWALAAFAMSLLGYSLVKVFVPTFYALNDTRTPVLVSLLAVVLNLLVSLTLVFLVLPEDWRFVALAGATTVSVTANSLVLAWKLSPRVGSFRGLGIVSTLTRSALAAVGMAPLVWTAMVWTAPLAARSFAGELVQVAGSVALGIGSYALFCRWLGVDEIALLVNSLLRRLGFVRSTG